MDLRRAVHTVDFAADDPTARSNAMTAAMGWCESRRFTVGSPDGESDVGIQTDDKNHMVVVVPFKSLEKLGLN